MKKILAVGFISLVVTASAFSGEGFKDRAITNNLWMPTGYTLNRGEFTVGIGTIGFGITDNAQAGTNILLYLFQVPNANLKVSLVKSSTSAFAIGVDLAHFNLDVFENESDFTTVSPYVGLSSKIGENTLLHLSGQFSFFSGDEDIDNAEADSYSTGTSVSGGIEYSYSYKTKFLVDLGYDATFEGLRLGGGVLWGWDTFRLKLGVSYYNPEGSGGFTLPIIGLWWRFRG